MRPKRSMVPHEKPKIQLCPKCGRMRANHKAGYYQCDINPDITLSLRRFRAANGKTWKAKLLAHWEKACADISDIDERSLLQQARNVIGPRRLYPIDLDA